MTDLPPDRILASGLREILIFPFRLDPGPSSGDVIASHMAEVKAALDQPGSGWVHEPDPLRHLDPGVAPLDASAYAEFAYFPPFIQELLYTRNSPTLRLYRRTDRAAIEADFGAFCITMTVERCLLYLFPGQGVALMVLELAKEACGPTPAMVALPDGSERPMTLGDVMVVLERLRRSYPPFWDKGLPGLSPNAVRWIGTDGAPVDPSPPATPEGCSAWIVEQRRSPLFTYWQAVLAPLSFDTQPRWAHVSDERIPLMAWVAVDQPAAITFGDWVRLAMLDGPDDRPLPYGAASLKGFDEQHCYDAFWAPDQGRTTRYLMSGYGFVVVGGTSDDYFTSIVRMHMRRHYFQLGLIAHFQEAAVLALSQRLSHADTLNDRQAEALRATALDFTHRLWFPDVSNHVQGRELFRRWRTFLNTDALYEQMMREANDRTAFLNARADRRSAEAAAQLNLIATVGLALSLVAGILGMNVLIPDRTDLLTDLRLFGNVAGGVSLLTGSGLIVLTRRSKNGGLRRTGIVAVILALALFGAATLRFVS